ncbi:DNA polymerase III subunit epsilon [Rhizosaccharibacter radicis]|uniref:DNA polymerase III subunit epsilon n=1 Tax=Rhizosaccharibacter radicis TaxID=2782605 RepID=A0ABT1VY23_9PROT|nr:DNA polymerase III subunit epsilon [Acetobacteraceae bacterium KSS12]
MARSILFDTETTGLDPATGDRVIEIAAIELMSDLPTGRTFHVLIDPERDVPEEASRVHGFTRADLAGKPLFADVAADFLSFIGDAPLIAHNARFDFGFLDTELKRAALPALDRKRMVDTLEIAKERFPGLPNSLDALCRRFSIDLSERTTHNALLDCRLLAQVYLELMGGRQRGLELAAEQGALAAVSYTLDRTRTPRPVVPTQAELAAHAAFLQRLKEPIWLAE